MNVLKFPTPKKTKKQVQPQTTIMIVDFKKKELVGEVEIDNLRNMVMAQWGKKLSKKVA